MNRHADSRKSFNGPFHFHDQITVEAGSMAYDTFLRTQSCTHERCKTLDCPGKSSLLDQPAATYIQCCKVLWQQIDLLPQQIFQRRVCTARQNGWDPPQAHDFGQAELSIRVKC